MQEELVELRHPVHIYASQPLEPPSLDFSLPEKSGGVGRLFAEPRDYVNAFVVNETGEAMIVEHSPDGHAWGSWRIFGQQIQNGEDPLTAVQTTLLQRTGYAAGQWLYLGTYVIDDAGLAGVGHFFCARQSKKMAEPVGHELNLKWVPRQQIKRALLDGRIAVINHAVAVSLALVMCDDTG